MELLVNDTVGQFRRAGAALLALLAAEKGLRASRGVLSDASPTTTTEAREATTCLSRGRVAGLRELDKLAESLRVGLVGLQAEWRPVLSELEARGADDPSRAEAGVMGREVPGRACDGLSCDGEIDTLLEEIVAEAELIASHEVEQSLMDIALSDSPDAYPLLGHILRMDAERGWTPTTRVAREHMRRIWSAVVNEIGQTMQVPGVPHSTPSKPSPSQLESLTSYISACGTTVESPVLQVESHNPERVNLGGGEHSNMLGTPPVPSFASVEPPSPHPPATAAAGSCLLCGKQPSVSEYFESGVRESPVALAEIVRLQRQVDYLTDQLQRLEEQVSNSNASNSALSSSQFDLEKQRISLQVEVEQCRIGWQSVESSPLHWDEMSPKDTAQSVGTEITPSRSPALGPLPRMLSPSASYASRSHAQGRPHRVSSMASGLPNPRPSVSSSLNFSVERSAAVQIQCSPSESGASSSQDGRARAYFLSPTIPSCRGVAATRHHFGDSHSRQQRSPSLGSWDVGDADAENEPEAFERICNLTPAHAGLLLPRYQDLSLSETISPCNTTAGADETEDFVEASDQGVFRPRVSLPAMTELIISQKNMQGVAAEKEVRQSSPTLGRARRVIPPSARRSSKGILRPKGNSVNSKGVARKPAKSEPRSLAREIADEFQVFSKEAVPESFRAMYFKALLQAEKENRR